MDKGHPASMIALSVTMPVLATMFVALRFFARRQVKTPLGWDDWLVIPALLLTIGMGVGLVAGVAKHATSYPVKLGPPSERLYSDPPSSIEEQKVQTAVLLLFVLQLGFVKCSIVAFIRRLFCTGHSKIFNILIKGFLALCAAWSFSFFLSYFFICGSKLSRKWGPMIVQREYCRSLAWENGFAFSNVFIDLFILLLPIPSIWRLHLARGRKLGVLLIMLLGAMAIVCSIIRAAIVFTVVNNIKSTFFTFNGNLLDSEILWWEMLEAGLSIIVACLPAIHSLALKVYIAKTRSAIRSSLRARRAARERVETAERRNQHGSIRSLRHEPQVTEHEQSESGTTNESSKRDLEATAVIDTLQSG